jgi:beta-galactosidase
MKNHLHYLAFCFAFLPLASFSQPHTFKIGEGNFLLDGKPFQLISGEMHFARIPRECWRDRLHMARAMGLNTVATYVFWNYHEPGKGKYNFRENADVAEFCRLAQEEGLWVIIRPSPYACAEWEFGGYPWWLLREKDLKVRSRDPRFMEMSRKYFSALAKQLVPLQVTHGGPIIMIQIENEYGSYGNDKEYLSGYRDLYRAAGFDVDLYTCDGPSQMPAGCLPGVLPAVNGLDNVDEVRKLVDKYNNGHGPYFIAEWYPAWFDSWGEKHHTVPFNEFIGTYDSVLAAGISINIYMAHGGTTRWFWNGANMSLKEPYSPQTSSYDYDAPIDEAGNPTPKYMAMREVIMKHLPPDVCLPDVPAKKKAIAVPGFRLTQSAPLFKNLPSPLAVREPVCFEKYGQGYGYILYRTSLNGPQKGVLKISQLRDYALVYVDGRRIAVLDRRLNQDSLFLDVPANGARLEIFVENNGRINYGPFLNDNRQGIAEKVSFGGKEITNWRMFGFPFKDLKGIKFTSGKASHGGKIKVVENNRKNQDGNIKPGLSAGSGFPANTIEGSENIQGPVLLKGMFYLSETGDTYVDMRNWGKGHVWINGRSIGKYWHIGPQQTLYVPAQWLKEGGTEIVVLEELLPGTDTIRFLDYPVLDELHP